jgi:hypothetical protein
VIVATAIFLPVYFPHNKPHTPGRVALFCILCLGAPGSFAIDTIEITAGNVSYEQQQVSDIHARLQLKPDSTVDVELSGNRASKTITLDAQLKGTDWQASTVLDADIGWLVDQYRQFTGRSLDWQINGSTKLALSLSGSVTDLSRFSMDYQLGLDNATGELADWLTAFETLDVQLNGRVDYDGNSRMAGTTSLMFESGLLAYDDLLIEPLAGPIHIQSAFSVRGQQFELAQLRLDDPGGLQLNIPRLKADIRNVAQRHDFMLNVESARFPHVYAAWLQPLLYGTVMEDIETEGSLSARLHISDRKISDITLDMQHISLTDKSGRYSIYDLTSQLQTSNSFESGRLSINWQGAELYQLLLGASELEFDISSNNLVVTSPFSIPLYDGQLKVFKLSVENLQAEQPVVNFDGILTPISLSSFSDAFGWPALHGSVSGVIPGVRYDESGLIVDGILLAKAFDGTFKIQRLRMSDLLSPLPRVSADFQLEQLDLEKLTRAFDFGHMEGKLSGHIAGLRMVDWKASAFDAFFYTPEDDDSRHVISQRAVDNLTSLSGSDIGSVLSRTYLRFFENFRYDRLGLGCILRNNICRMNGIAAATGSGYYIVKGGWLPPRLDIIGYSHQVDWPDLLGRLERVMSDNQPVIQ